MGRPVNDSLYAGMTIATLHFLQRASVSPQNDPPAFHQTKSNSNPPIQSISSLLFLASPLLFLLLPVLCLAFPSQSPGLIAWLISEAYSPFAFPQTPGSSYLPSPHCSLLHYRPHRPPTTTTPVPPRIPPPSSSILFLPFFLPTSETPRTIPRSSSPPWRDCAQ
jgi:hypothetical protein